MDDPLAWVEEYPIQWREPRLDLAELAKLRWIQGIPYNQLTERFGKTENAIKNHLQVLRRKDFRVVGLTEKERRKIKWASKN